MSDDSPPLTANLLPVLPSDLAPVLSAPGVTPPIRGQLSPREAWLLNNFKDAVVITTLDGFVTYWNDSATELFGWTADEVLGRHYAERFAEPTRSWIAAEISVRALGEEWSGEYQDVRKDGATIWIDARVSLLRDENGDPAGILGISRDISDRKNAELVIAESAARFRTIVEQSPFSIQVFSPDGRTIMVNRAWERLWGLTVDQLGDYNVLHDPQLVARGIMQYIQRGFAGEPTAIPAIHYDVNETIPGLVDDADRRRWVEAFIYPVKTENGTILQVILVHQDVSERMKAQEATDRHTAEVNVLNERLTRAMRETHHRVRNNLQMIAAFIDMRAMEDVTHVPLEVLRQLETQVKALAAVHDILTRESTLNPDMAAVSSRELLDKLLASLRTTIAGRTILSRVDEAALTSRQATALAIIVNELITNAAKYSDGDIEVQLFSETEGIQLVVSDRGPGFATGFDVHKAGSHGLSLVQHVTRWDLQGDLKYANRAEGGGQVTVSFAR